MDTSVRYTVDSHPGIAFRLLGPDVMTPDPELCCTDEDCHHDEPDCWYQPEPEESDTWVRMVMVGDDTVHYLEVTDVHPITDDDYCHECGQIGCTADGRN